MCRGNSVSLLISTREPRLELGIVGMELQARLWRVPQRGYPLNRGVHAGCSRVTSACLSLVLCFPCLQIRRCSHALFSLLYNVLLMHVVVCPIVNTSCRIAGYSCRRIQQVRVPVQFSRRSSPWRPYCMWAQTSCSGEGCERSMAATLPGVTIKQCRLPVPFRNIHTIFRVSCYNCKSLMSAKWNP